MNKIPEITLRFKYKTPPDKLPIISSSADLYKIVKEFKPFKDNMELKEIFAAVYLNQNNRVIGIQKISEGGITITVVPKSHVIVPVIILQNCALHNAVSVVLVHNHPSGNTTPSKSDCNLTKALQEVAKLLDITILDHLIITSNTYLSFSDSGLL
jgi:DNA repair protein RadC